ncbi:MAG: DNA-processing protein DprA [Candidatus Omnitrophota bacterium]
MNDFEAIVLLNMIPSLGSISIKRILEYFLSPKKVFEASSDELLKIEGITNKKVEAIKKAQKDINLEEELKLARENNINILTILESGYPESLKNIYDPPAVLYVKGQLLDSDYNCIAIIGSRRASFYGISSAFRISSELANMGITVVSGLARGIDAASHRGALQVNGRTIAVLGSGILRLYPPENKELAESISDNGAVVSEFSLKTSPLARNFPRRNRIISGFSLGVVVVEAARNSGALITADLAMQQSREVFAVPGKMDSVTSTGTHGLIKQGAKLISNTDDIIEEIAIKFKKFTEPKDRGNEQIDKVSKKRNIESDDNLKCIYEMLSSEPIHIDEIITSTNMSVTQLSSVLMRLQLKNMAKELPGKNFVRV